MAIIPEELYPGKITEATPDYPYGSARNITSPGDGTGTPLEQAWINDDWGFKQALLTAAGITPSGAADTVSSSQYLTALMGITVKSVDDYAALRLAPPTATLIFTRGRDTVGDGAGGYFKWVSGDQTDSVTADELGGVVVAPDSDPTGASGAWVRAFTSNPSPRWWGVAADGLTDDTEALRGYHAYCNRAQTAASYAGLESVAIQADAKIIVNTDWDLNNVTLKLLNGIVPPESWVTRLVAFRVFDEDHIYTTRSTPNFVTANLKKGSCIPTKGSFDDPGYVYVLDGGTRVPGRQFGDPTERYSQSFHIVGNGQTTQPLSRTLSNTTDPTSGDAPRLLYRRNSSRGAITVKNVKLDYDSSDYNFQHIISIERNNVSVDNVTVVMPSYAQDVAVNQLIHIYACANVSVSNLVSNGLPTNNGSGGGYVLSIDYAADIHLTNIQATDNTATGNGWGWIGTNHVNCLYVTESSVGRIDGHAGLHNVFVNKTTLTDVGVTYGWGGGVISVSQCSLVNSSAVYARVDYGNTFFGTVSISDIVVVESMGTARAIYSCKHIGASTVTTFAPGVVNIDGVTVQESGDLAYSPNKDNTVELIAIIPDVDASTSPTQPFVYAPSAINVSNVKGGRDVSFLLTLPLGSLSADGNQTSLNVSNITAGKVTLDLSQRFDTVSIVAGKTPCRIFADVDSVSTFFGCEFSAPDYPLETLRMRSIDRLIKLDVVQNETLGIQTVIDVFNSHLYNFSGGAVLGNTSNGTARHRTAFFSCTYDSTIDISGAGAIHGLIGRGTITLPSGVTKAEAFTGWANFGLTP